MNRVFGESRQSITDAIRNKLGLTNEENGDKTNCAAAKRVSARLVASLYGAVPVATYMKAILSEYASYESSSLEECVVKGVSSIRTCLGYQRVFAQEGEEFLSHSVREWKHENTESGHLRYHEQECKASEVHRG